MHQKLHSLARKLQTILVKYPAVLASAAIMASTIVYMIETRHSTSEDFLPARIIICSSLGISLFFALCMLSQRRPTPYWQPLGLLFLVGFYFILPKSEQEFTEMYAFVLIPTYILTHLLVAIGPFLGNESEMNFWQYNKNLFINLFLTAVFTGVLTGGVELAIVAVDQLFNAGFENEIYAETFFALAITGSVVIFLLFNERGLAHLEKDGNYPVVLKFFTQFILIPLLLIYVVILYFYSGKILLNWELPQGWVSYLVLAYSIVGILALLLVHPLKGGARSWVRIFNKMFYYSLLPLIVLLFTAIFTRVLEYGFTEPRYYVLLLAIWLLGVVLYFIFWQRPTIKFIPISLFLLGLFSLVFPYLNAFSVSARSQKRELETLLSANKLIANGKIDFGKPVTMELSSNVSDKIQYLSERFEYDYLKRLLDDKAIKAVGDDTTWHVGHLFTTKTGGTGAESSNTQLNSRLRYTVVAGYEYALLQHQLRQGADLNGDHFLLRDELYKKSPAFILEVNGSGVDLLPAIDKLFDNYGESDRAIDTDSLFVEADLGKYRVKVIFSDLSRSVNQTQSGYSFSDALFLVGERNP